MKVENDPALCQMPTTLLDIKDVKVKTRRSVKAGESGPLVFPFTLGSCLASAGPLDEIPNNQKSTIYETFVILYVQGSTSKN